MHSKRIQGKLFTRKQSLYLNVQTGFFSNQFHRAGMLKKPRTSRG